MPSTETPSRRQEAKSPELHPLDEHRRAIFGDERLAHDTDNAPTPEAATELRLAIANVCTGVGSIVDEGVYRYFTNPTDEHSPVLTWNDATIRPGFGSGSWDAAPASIDNLSYEERWAILPGRSRPVGKYGISEQLYFDSGNTPVVRRTITPLTLNSRFHRAQMRADKPANADEVAAALKLVKQTASLEHEAHLPVYVEIGFGVDPAALLGNRSFENKKYHGFDAAMGAYVTGTEIAYPETVMNEVTGYEQRVNSERPGEHILFTLQDGEQLPMSDGSVREVFASNILNAPDIDPHSKLALLEEAARILEPNGRLVIRVNWHQDVWTPEETRQLLQSSGFNILRHVENGRPAFRELEQEYGTQQHIKAPAGYYMIAAPSSSTPPKK